jgi:hypothetical protein
MQADKSRLDVNRQGPARGTLVGSFEDIGILFFNAYLNWRL